MSDLTDFLQGLSVNNMFQNETVKKIYENKNIIKEAFPKAIWSKEKSKGSEFELEVLNYESFHKEISIKYPNYIFQKEINEYDTFTYYGFIIKNIFNNPKFEDIRIGFYEEDLASLIRALEKINKPGFNILEQYRGFKENDLIEIGIYANRTNKRYNNIYDKLEKSISLEYNLYFKQHDVKVWISKVSPLYKTLYSNTSYNMADATIKIQNFPIPNEDYIIYLLPIVETSLNLKLYEDFQDMIELSEYSTTKNVSSKNSSINFKNKEKAPNNILELKYLNPIVLQYFQNVTRTDYLPFRYLGYYHILEYYFIECYEEFVLNLYKHIPAKFDDINIFLDKVKKYNSEEKMLELLLKKYIQLSEVTKIVGKDAKLPKNKISEEITLPEILIEPDSFYTNLSKRVYTLRNSIVHSKDKRTKGKALVYSKKNITLIYGLAFEVRLIKWVAETIVEANTQILDE